MEESAFSFGGAGLPTAGRHSCLPKDVPFAERPFVLVIMSVWKRCFALAPAPSCLGRARVHPLPSFLVAAINPPWRIHRRPFPFINNPVRKRCWAPAPDAFFVPPIMSFCLPRSFQRGAKRRICFLLGGADLPTACPPTCPPKLRRRRKPRRRWGHGQG